MPRIAAATFLLLASLAAGGCELVEGIFKVGFWVGAILVLLVVLVIWLIVRLIR